MTNRPRHVCFIFSYFPPLFAGGVERYLMNISRGLKEFDISSTILTMYYPPLSRSEQTNDYSLLRIGANPFPKLPNVRYINGFMRLITNRFTYGFFGFYEGMKIAATSDIICPQLGGSDEEDMYLGVKLANTLKKPCIVTVHGRFGQTNEDIRPTPRLVKTLHATDLAIVNRPSAQEFISNNITKSILMQNPIPIHEFKRPLNFTKFDPHRIHVLFVGRLTRRRGPDLALEGFIKAAKKNPLIDLWIVGEGELQGSLIKRAKDAGLSDRVFFFGKQLDVRKFLWSSDIFLATSPIANFPSLSLREAMAAGLCSIATDVDETKTIVIPEQTGAIVNVNSGSIAEAILDLANDDDLRNKLSLNAVTFAENHFNMRLYCQRLSGILHNIS
jgi:glycosyltransferase involved in cell wall biosynthesis